MRLLFTIIPLITVFASVRAHAETCIDYSDYMHWIADLETATNTVTFDMVVDGDLAYGVGGNLGPNTLQVFDVSDPAAPVEIGSLSMPTYPRRIKLSGSVAFVPSMDAGLVTVDVSDPASPAILDVLTTPTYAFAFDVEGDHAVVTDWNALWTVDATDPSALSSVGTIVTSSPGDDVEIEGTFAYVAGRYIGLQVFDIADPTAPALAGELAFDEYTNALDVVGSIAYVAGDIGLSLVDVSDPTHPQLLRTVEFGSDALSVTVRETVAFVGLWGLVRGLATVDVADPGEASVLGVYETRSSVNGVFVDGDLAYLSQGTPDPLIVDVSGLLSSAALGAVERDETWAVAVLDTERLVVADTDSVLIVDVSDDSSPSIVAEIPVSSGLTYRVAAEAGLMVAGGEDGLSIVDVSDPLAPVEEAFVPTLERVYDLALVDGMAYTVETNAAAHIYDLTDPQLPLERSMFYHAPPLSLTIDHPLAYIGTGTSFEVWDVSDPDAPDLLTEAPSASVAEIAADGSIACVATSYPNQVAVYDVSPFMVPEVLSSVSLPSFATGLAWKDDHLYVACTDEGIIVIDVRNPNAAALVGQIQTRTPARGISLGEVGYVATWNELVVIPGQCATTTVVGDAFPPVVGRAFPNPTKAGTTVSTWVTGPGRVLGRVFDPHGRAIRTISRDVSAGPVDIQWDGLDRHDRPVPPGVYWLRLRGAGVRDAATRIVVTR